MFANYFRSKPNIAFMVGIGSRICCCVLRLTLMISMLSVVSNTLVTSMMATGDIKNTK